MTKILVSVRTVEEALAVAAAGTDFIDLKEPREGALGGLPVDTLRAMVAALRDAGRTLPVSATIGDLPLTRLDDVLVRVHAVAACGVTWVKVGIPRCAEAEDALRALAGCGVAIVPVFIADAGLDARHVQQACDAGFAGVMVDTQDKRAGSLFDCIGDADLRSFLARARAADVMAGVAGALRLADLPRLHALAPDFAGFRSALCRGDRGNALDPALLTALRQAWSKEVAHA